MVNSTPKGELLSLGTIGIWGQVILCRVCPVHCGMCNRIPRLHPQFAGNIPPRIMTTKMSPDIANVPLGDKIIPN